MNETLSKNPRVAHTDVSSAVSHHYVVALDHCKVSGQLVAPGQVIARHVDAMDAALRCSRLRLATKRLDGGPASRDILWVLPSPAGHRVGDVSPILLITAKEHHRQQRCTDAMVAVLDRESGRTDSAAEAVIADALMRFGLTVDELRDEFGAAARAAIDTRTVRNQAIAEHESRRSAVQASVERDLNAITYSFPAVRGIQAGREYYAAQIPFPILSKLFVFDEEPVPAQHRAQRVLNERRAQEIADYVVENPAEYVLPALTASVSAEMRFEPVAGAASLGTLHIPLDATVLINDGQHRRKAIEVALRNRPVLARETIAVTIYFDQGLRRAQQMFADINGTQVKPSSAISTLYDQRKPFNGWVLEVLARLPDIAARIDHENASVGAKSTKLWSLVAFKRFVAIFTGYSDTTFAETTSEHRDRLAEAIVTFFGQVRQFVPDWAAMVDGRVAPVDARAQLVLAHAVWLHGLAVMGYAVLQRHQTVKGLERLSLVASARTSVMWEGRCVVHGKMQMTADGVKSTAAKLMTLVNIPLGKELATLEASLR